MHSLLTCNLQRLEGEKEVIEEVCLFVCLFKATVENIMRNKVSSGQGTRKLCR